MKKFLIVAALALSAVASTAHAEWTMITDSADGSTRLLGEVGSLETSKNNKGITVFTGKFGFAANGDITTVYAGVLASSCAAGSGQLLIGYMDETKEKYFWSSTGTRLYDFIALILCAPHQSPTKPAIKSNGYTT